MLKWKNWIGICLAVLAIGLAFYMQQPDDTDQLQEIPASPLPFEIQDKVLLTSFGQASDVLMVNSLMGEFGISYDFAPAIEADQIQDIDSMIVVIGLSYKGLAASGMSVEDELQRVDEIVKGIQKRPDVNVLVMHIGGANRRGDKSDVLIQQALEIADAVIVVESGDEDRLMESHAKENEIYLDKIDGYGGLFDALSEFIFQFKGESFDFSGYETLEPSELLRRHYSEETEVFLQDSGEEGPVVYIISGIHGDEIAGVEAAKYLATVMPQSGRLYVIPSFNKQAVLLGERTEKDRIDINRNFDGSFEDGGKDLLIQEFLDLLEKDPPDLVIDLHESRHFYSTEYEAGNSIIFSGEGQAALVAADIVETINGENIDQVPFSFDSPPRRGTLNAYVSEAFSTPVFTVETCMENPLELRVFQHIKIVRLLLDAYK